MMSNAIRKLLASIVKYKLILAIVCAVVLFVSVTGAARGTHMHATMASISPVYCQTFEWAVFPWQHGSEVRVYDQLCDGWGGSETVSVVLHLEKPARSQKIFVYNPMYAIIKPQVPGPVDVWPTITWVSNNEIHISLQVVGGLELQRKLVDGIRITYDLKYIAFCFPKDYKKWGTKCLRPVYPANYSQGKKTRSYPNGAKLR